MTIKLRLHKLSCFFAGGLVLISVLYFAFPAIMNMQNAGAQLDSLHYVNPLSPDFLSLAIDLTPQLKGVNLDLSNFQSKINCDLTLPVTYVSSGCMSQLQLLLPITEANSSVANQTLAQTVNSTLTPISLSIGVTSDNLTAGDLQTVTVTATNASSGINIDGAEISSNITDPSGNVVNQYNGTTDANGQATFTFTIPTDAETGTFPVDVTASAAGFDKTTETTSFDVVGGSDSNFDNSTNFDNGSSSSSDGSSSSSDGSSSSSGSNDFTSPTVKSTDPKDNDKSVSPSITSIKVTFSEKIDKNTVDTGSLTLDPNTGIAVPSVQDVSVSGSTATFTIDHLLPNVDYLATISSNIEDTNGNFLDCPNSKGVDSLCQWNFSTSGITTSPAITISPTSGPVGTPLTVQGTGFIPNTKVTITFDTSSGTDTTDNNGAFTFSFFVPNSSVGDHTVSASQPSILVSKIFTVTNPKIILNPNSGPNGTAVNITGSGFDPSSTVNLKFNATSLPSAPTDANGAFLSTFKVPPSSTGDHNVTASQGSNKASKIFTVTDDSINIAGKSFTHTSATSLLLPGNSSNKVFSNSSNSSIGLETESSPANVLKSFSLQKINEPFPESKLALSASGNNSSRLIQKSSAKDNQTTPDGSKSNSLILGSPLAKHKNKSSIESTNSLSNSGKIVKAQTKENLLQKVNGPPVAIDDIISIKNSGPVNIAALKNDRDPDNGDSLRIVGLSPPLHGTVISNANGTITYVPQPLWKGTDVFQYTVTDSHGGIASASVKVESNDVKNKPPKANTLSVPLIENNHAKILLKARDPDKDPLTFEIVGRPSHGTIVDFSSLSGSIVYTPDVNYVGHDSFTFKASDGKADSKTTKVSIRVIGDKHTHQTKQSASPNSSHEPPPQNLQQNNNPSSEPQQPNPQELKKIENQAEKQAIDQQAPTQQEQATNGNDNAEPTQQSEKSGQQDGILQPK